MRKLVLLLTVGAAVVVASLLLLRQLTVTSANTQDAMMSLNVKAPSSACDDPSKPTKCDLEPGSRFTLSVSANSLPGGPYIGIQTQLFYGGLVYKPVAVNAEIVWPQSFLPVRFPASPTGREAVVTHGDASALFPPFPESTHLGNIVEIALNCSAQPQAFKLALLPFNPIDNRLGAGFQLRDGTAVPAKPVGQHQIDVDGDTSPETVDIADTLLINCGQPLTPTATPVPATATPTPTPTPTVAGHAVSGGVCEFPLPLCGALRGATVRMLPLGLETTTSLDDGTFAFANVPNGVYSLTVSPGCTPFGCYEPTPVTVANADVFVTIAPVPFTPTPTITPTSTPTATPAKKQGDVNCDRVVNVVDALFILQSEVGQRVDSGGCPLPPPPPDTLNLVGGDVNKDRLTNVVDALFILQCEVGQSPGADMSFCQPQRI